MTPSANPAEAPPERPMRADARRNLERILDAADGEFAREGLDASVAEIARRAGVGQATLFRRFPTKGDLVAAVLGRRLDAMLEAVEAADREPRAIDGLRSFMEHIIGLQSCDRSLMEAGAGEILARPELRARQDAMAELAGELLGRAKADGDVRPEIDVADVAVLVNALSYAGAAVGEEPDAWGRYLDIVLAGLRPGGPAPRGSAPALDELVERKHAAAARRQA